MYIFGTHRHRHAVAQSATTFYCLCSYYDGLYFIYFHLTTEPKTNENGSSRSTSTQSEIRYTSARISACAFFFMKLIRSLALSLFFSVLNFIVCVYSFRCWLCRFNHSFFRSPFVTHWNIANGFIQWAAFVHHKMNVFFLACKWKSFVHFRTIAFIYRHAYTHKIVK